MTMFNFETDPEILAAVRLKVTQAMRTTELTGEATLYLSGNYVVPTGESIARGKIKAIKAVREITGFTLYDAMLLAESMCGDARTPRINIEFRGLPESLDRINRIKEKLDTLDRTAPAIELVEEG